MKKAIFLLHCLTMLLLFLFTTATYGQYFPLWNNAESDSILLNAGRIWSYNLYEHSRWGAGLRYVHTLPEGTHRFVADGWASYGLHDKHGKWGLTLDAVHLGKHDQHLYISAVYDLFAVGNRHLTRPSLTELSSYAAIMNRRLYHAERVALGWRMHLEDSRWLGAELRYSAEQSLFDSTGLLYPAHYHQPHKKTLYGYTELDMGYWNPEFVTLLLTLGCTEESGTRTPLWYMRALAQFDRTFHLAKWLDLRLFAQGGWCDGLDHRMPYSRMFDMGGSWGAPFFLGGSLFSARPNEFSANIFGLLSLQIRAAKPLWNYWDEIWQVGSNPRPFAGAGAAWGYLWQQDADGHRKVNGLDLQAPCRGIGEAVAGIDGIIRWSAVDIGIAVAYRLTPKESIYQLPQKKDNLMLLISASVVIE